MITKLSRDESLALLRRERVARLGCIAAGEPYVVPINYVLDGDDVFSHSLPGRKLAAMRENPRVCLQVDDIRGQLNWRSVIAYGTYEEIRGTEERARVLNLLLSLFPELTPVESFVVADASAPRPIAFRIKLNRVTGIGEG